MSEELPLLQFGGVPMRPSQSGYSTRDPYGAVVTNIPGGFSAIATDHLSGVYEVTATYQLDAVQYLYWGAFYHTTLKEGSMPFRAELSLDTPLIQEYVCQIVGQPSKPRFLGSGYTEVTLQLEAEPIIDDAYNNAVTDIVGGLGYDTSAILNLFDIYANEWCPTYLRPDFGVMLDFITHRYTRDGHAVGLSSLLSFSRASIGTDFVGGILTEFAVDVPRVGDGGLLVEREGDNSLLNTNSITWASTANTTVFNTGEQYDVIKTTSGSGTAYVYCGLGGANGHPNISNAQCMSVLVKVNPSVTSGEVSFNGRLDGGTQYETVRFSIQSGMRLNSVTSGVLSAGSTYVHDGWYLVYMSLQCSSISTNNRAFYIRVPDVDITGAIQYSLKYPKIETGSYPTSRIINGSQSGFRSAELVTAPVDRDTHTAIVEYEWDGLSYERTVFNLGDNTAAHSIAVKHRPSGFIELTAYEFGVVQATATYPAPPSAGVSKVAVSYSDSEIIFAVNGQSAALQIATPITSLTTLNLGQSYGVTEPLNAHVRRVYLKPERYSSAELAQVTS